MWVWQPEDYILLRSRDNFVINHINPHKYLPDFSDVTSDSDFDLEYDQDVLWQNLIRLKHPGPLSSSYPIFCLAYRETLLNTVYQLRAIQAIPRLYYPIFLLGALAMDVLGRENIKEYIEGSMFSQREWNILANIISIQTFLEDLTLEKVSVSEIVSKILKMDPNPSLIFQMARGIHVILCLITHIHATHMVDQVYPLMDLIEIYLMESEQYIDVSIQTPSNCVLTANLLPLDCSSQLLADPGSPFSLSVEFSDETIRRITNMSKRALRRSIIQNLWSYFEIQEIKLGQFSPIDEDITIWYESAQDNKLSNENINLLLEILSIHERDEWNEERIRMRILSLVVPGQSLAGFCKEYDSALFEERNSQTNSIVLKLLTLLKELSPTYKIVAPLNWANVLMIMEGDNAFLLPLLSPRGLLTLYSQVDVCVSPFITDFLLEAMKMAPEWKVSQKIDGIYNYRDGRKLLF